MESREIRDKFLNYFEKNGHKVVPSSSLIPDDPSVLLTTAGMQQFKKYYTGELDAMKDFGSKSTASVQKSFRTSDIDEVGDESHLTFFEMLGNFSFGGYWKKEAIKFAWEFITGKEGMSISPDRIYVTVHKSVPLGRDEESYEIWKNEIGLPEDKIKTGGIDDNFWGPTGSEGPCGPTTEIYVDGIEVWNIVFNEFYSETSREVAYKNGWKLKDLPVQGIDTGMGLERLAMVSQNVPTIFDTDLFKENFPFILGSGEGKDVRSGRIIADHIRGLVFMLADGIRPSNKDRGYILRKLIRRMMVHSQKSIIKENIFAISENRIIEFIENIINSYKDFYPELVANKNIILSEFQKERDNFNRTLEKGLKEFDKLFPGMKAQDIKRGQAYEPFIVGQEVGKEAFDLYQTYGFPIEVIEELLNERFYRFDERGFKQRFDEEFKKHQEISRAGSEAKFGGHGLYLKTGEVTVRDESEIEKVTRLHTATHLLHAALRSILGPEVQQDGSDITVERTRFDFRFPRKVAPEELKKVEDWVNSAIQKDLRVECEEMGYEEAVKKGALGFFREKYPERVKVYTMFEESPENAFSKELCGGPHVKHTGEIGTFKITKEESSSAGVRRIRAVINP